MLPDTEETRKIGIHKNQFKAVASIKISGYFDILMEATYFRFFTLQTNYRPKRLP